MTKNKVFANLQKELAFVNRRIDENIIKGRSYEEEARRHRVLKSQLDRMRRSLSFSFLPFSFW